MNATRAIRIGLFFIGAAAVTGGQALATPTMLTSEKAKITGKVTIKCGPPSTTLKVFQSEVPIGAPGYPGDYVDTGAEITTNAAGDGSVGIANVSSGTLIAGHCIQLQKTDGTVVITGSLVASVNRRFAVAPLLPGPNVTVIAFDEGTPDFLELLDPGGVYTLRLDPSEASFFATGTESIVGTGDLAASLLGVTSNELTFRIDANTAADGPNTLSLLDIGVLVNPGVKQVGAELGLLGTSSTFENGTLLLEQTFQTTTFFPLEPAQVVPEPSTFALLALGLVGAAGRRLHRAARGRARA